MSFVIGMIVGFVIFALGIVAGDMIAEYHHNLEDYQ